MSDSILRNEYEEVVCFARPAQALSHRSRAFGPPTQTAQQVATEFLRENLGRLRLGGVRIEPGDADLVIGPGDPTPLITVMEEKDIAGAKVVVYKQKALGIEIFGAHLGVQIDRRTMNVASLQSSIHTQVDVRNPRARDADKPKKFGAKRIERILGFAPARLTDGTHTRQVIYRFEPDAREDDHLQGHSSALCPESSGTPNLPPTTIAGLARGQHYICDEIVFRAACVADEAPVNWRMLVEPESGDVLYLRALVACASGLVFDRDPQTQGAGLVTGASSNAELNPFRSSVTLPGLVPSSPQRLRGEFVEIVDLAPPAIAPPTVRGSASAFNYDVRTNGFSAVCAYYNCDRLFRTMREYGFDVANYFDGTTFPVPVDHRGKGGQLNADAPGTEAGTGLGMLRFGLILPPNPVGIVTSNRVVWHEFGHALLWDHVFSPNFGFAHSAGDALAVILNDPGSLEPDRYDTFPWVQQGADLGRRHDRAVADGWAWFGPNYNTQYNGEQILSTTLFRFYRAIGGDADSLPTQTRAAQASAFLIFKSIGLLTSPTPYPEIFVQALQTADLTTPDFKEIAGGALHKVVRWAFEKQGLFQPDAAPGKGDSVAREGNPPEVDIYIDDGRAGEYEYQADHWSCRDIWVRRLADGGTEHQHPVVGQTNYMYVRVGNRGTRSAEGVSVSAYHAMPGTGLVFPDDWTSMDANTLAAAEPIPSGGSQIVGPFAFVPTEMGHECLLAIASTAEDPGNDETLTGSIPEHRFVPFDNNTGQRNVHPVGPERESLLRWFERHEIIVRNPFRAAKQAEIRIAVPALMREAGWSLSATPGADPFEMQPREKRRIRLSIEPGDLLDPEQVRGAIAEGDGAIVLTTLLDGELTGGLTYPLSFDIEPDDGTGDEIPDGPVRVKNGETIIDRPSPAQILRITQDRKIERIAIRFEAGEDEG